MTRLTPPRIINPRVESLRKKLASIDEMIFRDRGGGEASRLAVKYGYRDYIVARLIAALGNVAEVEELLEWNEKPLPETIRCNDYLIPCSDLVERLEQKGFTLSGIPWIPEGIEVVDAPMSVGATHEYLRGYYYIQDPGSMSVTPLLDPKPGEIIVDMAAAPGGKASHILQLARDRALLVAVEANRKRVRALRSNLQRLGFTSYIIHRMDSRLLPKRIPGLRASADKVLLDAPSSGEGIIRKDPSRKTSRGPEDLYYIHWLQLDMLYTGIELLKPGGILVYAACSTSPEEGELVISRILDLRNDVEVARLDYRIGSPGLDSYEYAELRGEARGCIRLWPHRHGTEGFFICGLRRKT